MPRSEKVSQTQRVAFTKVRNKSKACREKSADSIVIERTIASHQGQNLTIKR